ncbi:MAG: ABC transporter ATP-binding protein [Microcystis sp. M015S2]|uniref:ABC transporter ATP-binding protein n=1 Tax=unclassified Microcystis TaxID=2643300 RepID=UPI00258A1683|nr:MULTISPECIES: ABC transporter ATP-binding protein [unclassified Microcystis]MCA2710260.1 ABC transporter ATP-binding protein [Microcystis sp. M025S2]MCA2742646.1 ABC transporter ATP-binding protein [Microcystis sp. M015S2]MCA2761218.1 ABC transporter ATP-binding protein [Microcystis sp. M145S2]
MDNKVLDVHHLTVEFSNHKRTTVAVNNISFSLQKGQVLGCVGESGSGKSVTSLALMGLVPSPGKITRGEICFRPAKGQSMQAVDLLSIPPEELRYYRGGEMAMIFQEPMSSLNPVYNIEFQLTEAILLHQKVTPEQAKNQAISLLQEVRLLPSDEQLEEKYIETFPLENKGHVREKIRTYIQEQKEAILKRYPHELSGGQLQRVMIAMAISCNPTLLIADEPTTALDVTVQAEILRLLRDLCKSDREMSMVFISHDLGVINEIADQVIVMYQGEIVEQGTKEEVLNYPQHPYTKGLLACRPRLNSRPEKLPTVSDFLQVEKDSQGKIIDLQEITPPAVKFITLQEEESRIAGLQNHENILSVENLSVRFPVKGVFGQVKTFFNAVDQVSFAVKQGETLGLVGESGCGKSTLARTILRLIPATSGNIYFRGENLAKLNPSDPKLRLLRRELQIVFQNPYNSLNPRLSIGKAILEPMVIHHTGGNSQKRRQRVEYLLERVKLDPNWFDRYPHQLSGGQRQRVCIARALALNPQFIICDESVSALDVSVQAGVLNLLKELQQEFNLTYIFISHDLSVVRFMSDRIMVMNKGKIEEIGTANEIINSPQSDYTRKLIASIPQFTQSLAS